MSNCLDGIFTPSDVFMLLVFIAFLVYYLLIIVWAISKFSALLSQTFHGLFKIVSEPLENERDTIFIMASGVMVISKFRRLTNL